MKKYALATLIAISVAMPAYAQTAKSSNTTMAIKGVGQYEVKPDYAIISVNVTSRDRSPERVLESHATRVAKAAAFLEELKKEGLEIKTSSFRLRTEQKTEAVPVRNGLPRQKPVGPREFVAHTDYQVTTRNLEGLSEMAGQLASSNVLEISSFFYDVDNPRAALLQARRAAVTDAREQAEIYADAASIQLVEVTEITDGEASRGYSNGDQADLPSRRAAGLWVQVAQIIPPAVLNYDASVNVIWRIAPKSQ